MIVTAGVPETQVVMNQGRPPVLVPNLSERDRAAAVAALTDILTAWWTRQQTAADRPDVRPEP